jgi:hypothetical protein
MYDCPVGGAQSFAYSGAVIILPSPSFTFSYYWLRPDGSVTPTKTVTTQAGATSVPVDGDSITLTAPNPPPPVGPSPIADYTDTLVVINAPAVNTQSDVHQTKGAGMPVMMPNCSDYTATPTSPPAPTPTATPIPTATATP